jgi:predicted O-methyltransferase YrrM
MENMDMPSILNDQKLGALLERLHRKSNFQINETNAYIQQREKIINVDQPGFYDENMNSFLSDKMVALDQDKAEFCYLLCRSLGAGRIVEAGTSFGVSTLYLAAAVRDNLVRDGVVIGTEHEPRKVEIAQANFKEAGLAEFIDLREGDLRKTLQNVGGQVDFMLIDIWEVAREALELVSPSLRPGAIVACDNTSVDIAEYGPYFEFVNNPKNRLRSMTVPFKGGFELSVRV